MENGLMVPSMNNTNDVASHFTLNRQTWFSQHFLCNFNIFNLFKVNFNPFSRSVRVWFNQ